MGGFDVKVLCVSKLKFCMIKLMLIECVASFDNLLVVINFLSEVIIIFFFLVEI